MNNMLLHQMYCLLTHKCVHERMIKHKELIILPTNDVVQLTLSTFVVNVLSQEINEANTIHPNDGYNVQKRNGNIVFI